MLFLNASVVEKQKKNEFAMTNITELGELFFFYPNVTFSSETKKREILFLDFYLRKREIWLLARLIIQN